MLRLAEFAAGLALPVIRRATALLPPAALVEIVIAPAALVLNVTPPPPISVTVAPGVIVTSGCPLPASPASLPTETVPPSESVTALRLAVSAAPGTRPPAQVTPSDQLPLVMAVNTCARAGASAAKNTAASAGRIFPRGSGRAEARGKKRERAGGKGGAGRPPRNGQNMIGHQAKHHAVGWGN